MLLGGILRFTTPTERADDQQRDDEDETQGEPDERQGRDERPDADTKIRDAREDGYGDRDERQDRGADYRCNQKSEHGFGTIANYWGFSYHFLRIRSGQSPLVWRMRNH
jgi:hypothetical protein